MSIALDALCCQACGLVQRVGEFIAQHLGQVAEIEVKALNSLVSFVDRQAEQQLVEGLRQLLPESVFLTEEETVAQASGQWQWIVDPLDGTTNFLHQIPFFSISVALRRGEDLVMGIVYEVNRKELFYSWEGASGVFLNGKPVACTQRQTLSESLLATGFPYYDFAHTQHYIQLLQDLFPRTRGLRRLGSAALDLAYVACGRFDAFFEYSLAPWDVAAGSFLVRQAGGIVTDFQGGTDYLFGRSIVAGNATGVQAALLAAIQNRF
jgi:myo-inositol-1(or 4)-monophosphatase